jgi:branched-chain amino acid transport system permease protein
MQYLIQLLISGLAIGAIYGLIAMGFAVIYKSTGLVNFAQGEMTMITAYIAWTISTTVSGNVFVVAVGAVLAAVVLGLVIERVVMRPMLGEPVFATVMVTIGLAVILRSSINFIWDAYPHGLDIGVGRTIVRIGSIGVRTGQIAVIVTFCCCSQRSGVLPLQQDRRRDARSCRRRPHRAADGHQRHQSMRWPGRPPP